MDTKIKASHLKKQAVLYIRQSTMRQVLENNESTMRQYALQARLNSLGWADSSIKIIDSDLGQSGAKGERQGFKELVADVGTGEVGAVACLECSRLSRNSGDWARLTEICALTKTLLIDADGIYDPNSFNDRILLGLKGTMSEAELHYLRERMTGGRLNKAKRGELQIPLPVGYIYDPAGRIVKNPDTSIQNAVQLFFDTFKRVGTARGTVVFFKENGYKFPVRQDPGYHAGEHSWHMLNSHKAVSLLHNPTYAGIYAYGRNYSEHTIEGRKIKKNPESEWIVRLEDNHESYISIDDYYRNIAQLEKNNSRKSGSPPREGTALLQGIALCGKCGRKMKTRYTVKEARRIPFYDCNDTWNNGERLCQHNVPSASLDEAVSNLILEQLTTHAINAAVEVEQEIIKRKAASDNYFLMQIERAEFELNIAKKRYMNVDPENRLVAFELERLWNDKIALLAQAEREFAKHKHEKNLALSNAPSVAELGPLDEEVREIWQSGKMRIQDKKRIIRCLIDEVTITRGENAVSLGIIFKTGASKVIECERIKPVWEKRTVSSEIIDFIRQKAPTNAVNEILDLLHQKGFKTGYGLDFSARRLQQLMKQYKIPRLVDHLREQGYITSSEKAKKLGISLYQLNQLRNQGKLPGNWKIVDGRSAYMYTA